MKKVLNVIGIFFSIIMTIVLTSLIIGYVMILNLKSLVKKDGLIKVLENVDLVSVFKEANDGEMWDEIIDFGDGVSLTEQQLIEIVNTDAIKKDIASYITRIIESIDSDKAIQITSDELKNTMNIAIDEYNKVAEVKISDEDRTNILNSIDVDRMESINEKLDFLDITENIPEDLEGIRTATAKIVLQNYSLVMIFTMVLIIGIIALLRFSYYKWMKYVAISCIAAASIFFLINLGLSVADIRNTGVDSLLIGLRDATMKNLYIISAILVGLAIFWLIIHRILKNVNKKDKIKKEEKKNNTIEPGKDDMIIENNEEAVEQNIEEAQKEKNDKLEVETSENLEEMKIESKKINSSKTKTVNAKQNNTSSKTKQNNSIKPKNTQHKKRTSINKKDNAK